MSVQLGSLSIVMFDLSGSSMLDSSTLDRFKLRDIEISEWTLIL